MRGLSIRKAALVLAISMGLPAAHALAASFANPHLLDSAESLSAKIAQDREVRASGGESTLRVIDVRKADVYRAGHIPGSINVPFTELTDMHAAVEGALKSDTALAALLGDSGIHHSSQVVIYDDQGGFRASRLFWLLEYYGHRNVSLLDGGVDAWIGAGLPLDEGGIASMADAAREYGRHRPTEFSITRSPRRFASADTIMNHRYDENTIVVDVRPAAQYANGHIPWAVNIPWMQNLTPDGMLKSADELMAHFAGHGITMDSHVIIHCQTGEASAHTYFAMRVVGFSRVRTYHRSWAEWGSDPSLPKS
ncbi:MAG: sulfurtransferase [Pseudomonadota bacterium]